MSDQRLVVTSAPHIHSRLSASRIMWEVNLALLPAVIAAAYFFGIRALIVIGISILSAMLSEAFIQKYFLRREVTINDGSAFLTGLLLALCIPPTVPYWIPAVGSFFAIAIGKQIFGGLGFNLFNPAHVGRAFLLASWPVAMTTWVWPENSGKWFSLAAKTPFDVTTTATPLALNKLGGIVTPHWDLFIGNVAGSIGETSALALLIGAAFLFIRRHIDWRIPFSYIGTVAILAVLFKQDPLFHVLAGGLIIGAFFMATDYTTSPVTKRGRIIFGIGCGLFTVMIRLFGGYPEGVCYAILFMNAFVPLIDRYTQPRVFGEVRK